MEPPRLDTSDPSAEPRRTVVLHPRTAAARRQDRARSFGGHVRGYTVDTNDVMALMRRQRRLGLRYLACVVVPLLAGLVALRMWPSLGSWALVGGIPAPWLFLGPVALFGIVIAAFFHERAAGAIEEHWIEEHR